VPPRRLDLVYNPLGPTLPGPQAALEAEYRARLRHDHGIVFDRLLTLTNMPIHRFAEDLRRQGKLAEYEDLLAHSFNAAAADEVMCRDLVSVNWDGRLSDCDFNQMLDLPLGAGAPSIFELDDLSELAGARVTTGNHCLGCTAGQGSGCGGALTQGMAVRPA
jgi:radical SAM/Cys-rich protein